MPTARFTAMIGIPEQTYRRWQAKVGGLRKGPWPTPARDVHRKSVADLATQHPAWGPRRCGEGPPCRHAMAMSTMLRILDDDGLLGDPQSVDCGGPAPAIYARGHWTRQPAWADGPRTRWVVVPCLSWLASSGFGYPGRA